MNRLEWILGIILVVLLLVVGALSLTFWFRNDRTAVSPPAANSATTIAQRADDIAPTPDYEGRSAVIAYAVAQNKATAWQTDAQLLSAQATWPQGASAQALLQGEESWGFTFYSPAAQKIAVFSVVEDDASLVAEGDHQQTDPVLSTSGWNLDSRDAIQIFINKGGQAFLAEQGVSAMTMSLLASDTEENGRLEWLISLFSLQTGQSLTMRLDATSGELLATNPES
ncbi:hypothetical protein [Candidatus Leptofilum sp.]|uniref:hypothetical protein n=1 Tax=Candidatus Leptofilum sp. TaxID=3241576 RepID=UPI003B5CC514